MHSGVPSLPVVCSDKHSCTSSKYSDSINGTPRRSSHMTKRRPFNDLYANSPYRSCARFYPLSQPGRSKQNPVGQRVLSAKMLRFKQLQNQLTDAHYHLNELSNENKLLKAIQKKQESALKKYEGANAELPRIINSHHEELRILQMKHKKLKDQYKQTCDNLKEKEKELHSLQVFNKRLLALSQDRNLLERDKLQSQVADLNLQIQQQQDTIHMLNKKLNLETKLLRQQMHAEVVKHKETQKSLQDSLEKLRSLEDLLDNREKRMYYNNQLPAFNKNRILGNCSFSSLEDSGVSLNYSKSSVKKVESDMNEKILPNLSDLDINFERKLSGKSGHDGHLKFRLPRPSTGPAPIDGKAKSLDRLDKAASPNVPLKLKEEDEPLTSASQASDLSRPTKEDEEEDDMADKPSKKSPLDDFDYSHFVKLTEELRNVEANLQQDDLFRKSREVCARLVAERSPAEPVGRTSYEEIHKLVKSEFKIGHDMATSMLQREVHTSFACRHQEPKDKTEEDIESAAKSQAEPETSGSPTEDTKAEEDTKVEDSRPEASTEPVEPLSPASSQDPGSRTFRTYNLDYPEVSGIKDPDARESEVETLENEARQQLKVFLDMEDKLEAQSRSLEKNADEVGEGKKNGLDKKVEEKLPKKGAEKPKLLDETKVKLLAEMKAIDNNDNIEYYDQKGCRRGSGGNLRSQITENLFRGVPTQRRGEPIPNLLVNRKLESTTRGNGLVKFH